MKMQVMFLPHDEFALVLSEVDAADPEITVQSLALEGFREEVGAKAVVVSSIPVELEGFAALGDERHFLPKPQTMSVDEAMEMLRS